MKSYIWDTGALSLYFSEHTQCKSLMEECMNSKKIGYVPFLILSEFYYLQWRKFGSRLARMRAESIINSQLITLILNEETVFTIGEFKVKHPELSLADSVLIALSKENHSTIITSEKLITEIKGVKAKKINY